jgi:DNA-binding transcriptional LysR family regulator
MNLTFRQLEVFREVMRTGSISEAARALGRAQPSISAMLAKLEDELGFKLFQRQRGRLVAHPEAHYFLEEADHVLGRLALSTRTMNEIANLQRGRLRIACMPAASGFLLPRTVGNFVKDRPDVSVSLMTRSSTVVEEWIASQQYDIGMAETPAPRNSISMRTFELNCVCAIPVDDELAKKSTITPQDLHGKPMAALVPEHTTHKLTRRSFRVSNAKFNQRFELQTFQPALELVEQALCYSVCDSLTAAGYGICRPHHPGVVFRPFRPIVPFSVAILTPAHRPASRLTLAFSKMLAETIRSVNVD